MLKCPGAITSTQWLGCFAASSIAAYVDTRCTSGIMPVLGEDNNTHEYLITCVIEMKAWRTPFITIVYPSSFPALTKQHGNLLCRISKIKRQCAAISKHSSNKSPSVTMHRICRV